MRKVYISSHNIKSIKSLTKKILLKLEKITQKRAWLDLEVTQKLMKGETQELSQIYQNKSINVYLSIE